ncbi:MAG: TolC family protein [Candidatus Margulisiibacteriota bacterium]|jgi:outer membrane protein TolC
MRKYLFCLFFLILTNFVSNTPIFAIGEINPSQNTVTSTNVLEYYTIDDSINYALDNNLSIQQNKLQIEKSKYQIQSAWAMVMPTLKVDASGGKFDTYATRAVVGERNYYQSKLNVNQLLFATYILPALDIANLSLKVSIDQYEATKDFITYQVNQIYYTILRAANLKKIAEDSIKRNSDHLIAAQELYKIGLTTKANVLQTEARLKDTEQSLTEADKYEKIAKVNFNLILNRDIKKNFNIDDKNFQIIATKNIQTVSIDKLDMYIQKALQRPNIQMLYKNKDIVNKTISVQESGYYPSVFASGSYGFYDYTGFKFNNNNRDWAVAVGLSWTLFDGFLTNSKVNMAKNDYAQISKNIELTENTVNQEILDALLSIKLAKDNIETSKIQTKYAQESYKLFTEQFKAGLSTNQELLDAEYALSLAQVNYVNSIFNLILARKKLEYLTNEL